MDFLLITDGFNGRNTKINQAAVEAATIARRIALERAQPLHDYLGHSDSCSDLRSGPFPRTVIRMSDERNLLL